MKYINYLNYWSLVIEFYKIFGNLSYRGIPLPMLSHFNQYLNDDLIKIINSKIIFKHIDTKIILQSEVQPQFEIFINKLKKRKPINNHPTNSYIVLCDELLHLPTKTLKEYFDSKNTIILTKIMKEKNDVYPLKQVILDQSPKGIKSIIELNLKKTKEIFSHLENHPIFGNSTFRKNFYKAIPKMIRTIEATNLFFDKFPTACLLTGTTQTLFPRTLTLVGHTRGIASICLQHGNIVGEASFLPIFATKNAIHGEIEKNWYLDRGATNKQLEITGHPRFDDLFLDNRHLISESEFNNKKKYTILVATQPILDPTFYRDVINDLAKDPLIEIIIKPHPKEIRRRNIEKEGYRKRYLLYKKLASSSNSIKLFNKNTSIQDLLKMVDIVVVWCSTVGLEAMLYNKPVFMLNTALPNNFYDSLTELQNYIHSTPMSISASIKNLVRSEQELLNTKKIIKKHIQKAYPQKNSSKKLKQLINYMLNQSGDFNEKE